jgi:DNA polymerase-3 subunit beta
MKIKKAKKDKSAKESKQKRTRKQKEITEIPAKVETIPAAAEPIEAPVVISDTSHQSDSSDQSDQPISLDTVPTQSEVPLTLSTEGAIAFASVDRGAILSGLKVAQDFISSGNSMPILSNALLEVKKDEIGRMFLTLAATDLEVSWKATYPCEATEEISRAVPLKTFYSELKALTDDIKDAELAFKTNAVQVNGRCDIYTVPGDEYPQLPSITGNIVHIGLPAVRSILPAVGNNDARYILNGALIDFEKGIAVGTDGHRLHMADIEKQDHRSIVIPRGALEILSKHGGNEISLQVSEDHKFFCRLADGEMTGKLIDGSYPNYEQVIPKETPITLEFSAKDMMKVFEGCLPLLNTKTHAVAFLVNGKIEVQATSSDRGIYKWHVPGTITGKGPEEVRIGFNLRYLQDAFMAYAGQENATVTMGLSDPLGPCLINGKAVVMPMRV